MCVWVGQQISPKVAKCQSTQRSPNKTRRGSNVGSYNQGSGSCLLDVSGEREGKGEDVTLGG